MSPDNSDGPVSALFSLQQDGGGGGGDSWDCSPPPLTLLPPEPHPALLLMEAGTKHQPLSPSLVEPLDWQVCPQLKRNIPAAPGDWRL